VYFDWITWSIWLIGFLILVVWVWIPIKEIKMIVKKKHKQQQELIGERTRVKGEK
jgi:hypothetical protein